MTVTPRRLLRHDSHQYLEPAAERRATKSIVGSRAEEFQRRKPLCDRSGRSQGEGNAIFYLFSLVNYLARRRRESALRPER
jgi:hypothetical protein